MFCRWHLQGESWIVSRESRSPAHRPSHFSWTFHPTQYKYFYASLYGHLHLERPKGGPLHITQAERKFSLLPYSIVIWSRIRRPFYALRFARRQKAETGWTQEEHMKNTRTWPGQKALRFPRFLSFPFRIEEEKRGENRVSWRVCAPLHKLGTCHYNCSSLVLLH